jgi:hypothetical protein
LKLYIKAFLISILLFLPLFLSAQKIQGGMAAGFNLTMVDGDEFYGYKKFGINAGPMVLVPLGEKITVNIETIYNQKGSREKAHFEDSLSGAYHLKLDYLEVPFYIQYHDRAGANAGLGFSWGRLVNFKESEHGNKLPWTKSTFPYKKDDWNFLADVSFNLKKGWKLNMRYFYSFNVIRKRTFKNGEERKQYNTGFTFRLIYIINEPNKNQKS